MLEKVKFECPRCRRDYTISIDMAVARATRKRAKCPRCRESFEVAVRVEAYAAKQGGGFEQSNQSLSRTVADREIVSRLAAALANREGQGDQSPGNEDTSQGGGSTAARSRRPPAPPPVPGPGTPPATKKTTHVPPQIDPSGSAETAEASDQAKPEGAEKQDASTSEIDSSGPTEPTKPDEEMKVDRRTAPDPLEWLEIAGVKPVALIEELSAEDSQLVQLLSPK